MAHALDLEYLQHLRSVVSNSEELRSKLCQTQEDAALKSTHILSDEVLQRRNPFPRLYALTIGIDNYRNHPLKGCVADADAIDTYLRSELDVPESQIKRLRNEDATRAAIINGLTDFVTNPEIEKDDPILVYYAGHGGEALRPSRWFPREPKTQMLIPYDCGMKLEGQVVHGIPDRTLAALLKQVADAKGNNITVILDNCFSASGTRACRPSPSASESPSCLFRFTDYLEVTPGTIPEDLDADIIGSSRNAKPAGDIRDRGLKAAPGFQNVGLKSHVLLAACGSGERAREINGRGVFTKALLDRLVGLPIDQITYKELLYRVGELPLQNPQCEGEFQDRVIFKAKVRQRTRIIHSGWLDNKTKRIVISAGSAHGITKGCKFSIWKSFDGCRNWKREHLLTVATVSDVDAFSSKAGSVPVSSHEWLAIPSTSLGSERIEFVAEHIDCGVKPDLILHVPRDTQMNGIFEGIIREMLSLSLHRTTIKLSSQETAYINVLKDPEHPTCLAFDINDPEVNRHGLKRLPHIVSQDAGAIKFHRLVHGFAHYEYHLRRRNVQPIRLGKVLLEKKVTIGVFKVPRFDPDTCPDTDFEDAEDLNVAGEGVEIVQDGSWYMIRIQNDTKCDLYAALFFFDNSDLSITSLYQPPTAGRNKVDPPLRAGQSLIIGYGGGTGEPFVFDVRGNAVLEVGFLKLFLTTEYVDFSDVETQSPFWLPDDRGMLQSLRRPSLDPSFWDTILLPFVVRRESPSKSNIGNAAHWGGSGSTETENPPTPVVGRFSPWKETFVGAKTVDRIAQMTRSRSGKLTKASNPGGHALAVRTSRSKPPSTIGLSMGPQMLFELSKISAENKSRHRERGSPSNHRDESDDPSVLETEDFDDIKANLEKVVCAQAEGSAQLCNLEKRIVKMRETIDKMLQL